MQRITLDEIRTHMDFFIKMYDVVRVVDPVAKRVMDIRGDLPVCTEAICYQYWNRNAICDNCISVRAHREGQCCIKLERSDSAIMMALAMPVPNAERPLVMELLSNATRAMMISDEAHAGGMLMSDYIRAMNEQIYRDALTGVYNRRFAEERLPADIVQAVTAKEPLSVAFLDVDNLKAINDGFGHACGDRVLCSVAETLSRRIAPDEGWVSRYGGDEFLLCLHRAPLDDALRTAGELCGQICSLPVPGDSRQTLSASVGVACMADRPLTAAALIAAADRQMYLAKKQAKGPDGGAI